MNRRPSSIENNNADTHTQKKQNKPAYSVNVMEILLTKVVSLAMAVGTSRKQWVWLVHFVWYFIYIDIVINGNRI